MGSTYLEDYKAALDRTLGLSLNLITRGEGMVLCPICSNMMEDYKLFESNPDHGLHENKFGLRCTNCNFILSRSNRLAAIRKL